MDIPCDNRGTMLSPLALPPGARPVVQIADYDFQWSSMLADDLWNEVSADVDLLGYEDDLGGEEV